MLVVIMLFDKQGLNCSPKVGAPHTTYVSLWYTMQHSTWLSQSIGLKMLYEVLHLKRVHLLTDLPGTCS